MVYLLSAGKCSSSGLGAILTVFQKILTIIHIVVPIILIFSVSYRLFKMMMDPEDKKGMKQLMNSILAAIIIFLLPTFLNIVMDMAGQGFSVSSCWNAVKMQGKNPTYIETRSGGRHVVIIDPDDYQVGEDPPDESDPTGNGSIDGTAKQVGDVVWDSSNVTRISNLTSSQLIGILNAYGGNAKNFIPYAQGLIAAEHKYQVNVFFLIGIEALESGWITSSISRNCNNLGGVCATSSRPSNGCGSNDNCSFAYFSSVNDFIDHHASLLHHSYLTPGGDYYEGTSPSSVVIHYCPGCTDWPILVNQIANELFSKVSSVL